MHLLSLAAHLGGLAAVLASPVDLDERAYPSKPNCPTAGAGYLAEVKQQFYTDQIVPDLIERINPTLQVNAAYGTKKVDLGTYFTTEQTINQPTVSITAEAGYDPSSTTYSLFLIDPDVPQEGSAVQVNFCHYIISHLQPACVKNQSSVVTVLYEPLTPASTTQHRYTFLVYREPKGYQPNTVGLQIRSPFDINDYTQDYNLTLVGGNFLKEAISNGLQG